MNTLSRMVRSLDRLCDRRVAVGRTAGLSDEAAHQLAFEHVKGDRARSARRDASPQHATVEWRCQCGATATRLMSAPTEPEPTHLIVPGDDAATYYAQHAALAIRNGTVSWARRQLRRALDELGDDPRHLHVQTALEALEQGDVVVATAAVAHALENRRA